LASIGHRVPSQHGDGQPLRWFWSNAHLRHSRLRHGMIATCVHVDQIRALQQAGKLPDVLAMSKISDICVPIVALGKPMSPRGQGRYSLFTRNQSRCWCSTSIPTTRAWLAGLLSKVTSGMRLLLPRGVRAVRCLLIPVPLFTTFAVQEAAFFGTLLPFLRALESPMAMACLRLLTLPPLPPGPLSAMPRL
jgi:hypothetical protein